MEVYLDEINLTFKAHIEQINYTAYKLRTY